MSEKVSAKKRFLGDASLEKEPSGEPHPTRIKRKGRICRGPEKGDGKKKSEADRGRYQYAPDHRPPYPDKTNRLENRLFEQQNFGRDRSHHNDRSNDQAGLAAVAPENRGDPME